MKVYTDKNDPYNIVANVESGYKVYKDDIEIAIDEACVENDIGDLKKAGQQQWKYVLQYVGQKVFTDRMLLKGKVTKHISDNNIEYIHSYCNRFNNDTLLNVYNYYEYISNKYNKLIGILPFSYFSNIDYCVIESWKHFEPTTVQNNIYKRLRYTRRDCIMDHAYDSSNVTGTMFVGNYDFGMNMPGVNTSTNKPLLPVKDTASIAAKYGCELPDNLKKS